MKLLHSMPILSLSIAIVFAFAPTGKAAVVNVDFTSTSAYSGQGAMASPGNVWNAVMQSSLTVSGLVDSQGNATSIGLNLTGVAGTTLGTETITANPLLHRSLRGLDNNPNSQLTLTLNGLTPNTGYDIVLYGGQMATFGGVLSNYRGSTYNINGEIQASTFDKAGITAAGPNGFAVGVTHAAYSNVLANGAGEIVVAITPYTASADAAFPVAFINGLQVTAAIPEPASALLCIMGLGFIGIARRKRQ